MIKIELTKSQINEVLGLLTPTLKLWKGCVKESKELQNSYTRLNKVKDKLEKEIK